MHRALAIQANALQRVYDKEEERKELNRRNLYELDQLQRMSKDEQTKSRVSSIRTSVSSGIGIQSQEHKEFDKCKRMRLK